MSKDFDFAKKNYDFAQDYLNADFYQSDKEVILEHLNISLYDFIGKYFTNISSDRRYYPTNGAFLVTDFKGEKAWTISPKNIFATDSLDDITKKNRRQERISLLVLSVDNEKLHINGEVYFPEFKVYFVFGTQSILLTYRTPNDFFYDLYHFLTKSSFPISGWHTITNEIIRLQVLQDREIERCDRDIMKEFKRLSGEI